jgi:hypothetical protein
MEFHLRMGTLLPERLDLPVFAVKELAPSASRGEHIRILFSEL